MIADESSTCTGGNSRQKGGNRRKIKLSYKKINKIASGIDLTKYNSKLRDRKIKEQEQIMGCFAIIIYDLQTNSIHKMKDKD